MNRISRPHLGVAAGTHPGLSGKTNEDRFSVTSFESRTGQPVLFAVVADGIGGHRAGEVAAELAVATIVRDVGRSGGDDPLGTMEAAIHEASQTIAESAARNPDQLGMGCTCACSWIEADRLYTAHVGDSRIYLIRDGQIHRTSVDHTWVQEAIEKGVVAPEDAHNHPNAHVLRRHLGSPDLPKVDLRLKLSGEEDASSAERNQGLELGPGDMVLLCSDGLTDMVPEEQILQVTTARRDPRVVVDHLIQRANRNGGFDNVTVVLLCTPRPLIPTTEIAGALKRVLKV